MEETPAVKHLCVPFHSFVYKDNIHQHFCYVSMSASWLLFSWSPLARCPETTTNRFCMYTPCSSHLSEVFSFIMKDKQIAKECAVI